MSTLLRIRSISFSILTTVAVVSCGGGSGNDGSNMVAGGGVTGTGVSVGTVTGFGSVFVNGVKYNTDGTTITLDDNPVTEDELRVGMVVKVKGSINDDNGATGTAMTISYNDILEGTVDTAPDLGTRTFVAMGQKVQFDNLTVFEDNNGAISTFIDSAGSINAGNVVEVSGWVDDAGIVRASRIERKALAFDVDGANELEIKGKIANLDEVDKEFTIGGLTVNYRSAVMLEGVLVNGGLVEVKSIQALTVGPTMIASQIEREQMPLEGIVTGWVEVEGYVTAPATSTADFTLLGMPVKTTNATVYEDGVAGDIYEDGVAGDIALGKKLKVKGVVGSSGVLVANLVVFKRQNNIKIEAVVDAVDPDASTVTLLGITVQVNSATQMEDDRDDLHTFSLTDLNPGDFVEVRGYMQGGDVIVSRLERDGDDEDAILQGPVSAKVEDGNNSSLAILGVTVNTPSGAIYRLYGGSPAPSQADFYAAVTEDVTIVKAKDKDFSGTSFNADEVQIESPD